MKKSSKRFSPVTFAVAILVAGAAVAAAMYLADDDDFDDLFASDERKVTQPLELRGRWLGMSLAGTDSPAAREMRVPPSAKGVVVVELAEATGWRARRAGLVPGDLITAVDNHEVRDMADFYDVTADMDITQPIVMEVLRMGQPLSLVLPAVGGVPVPGQAPGQVAVPGQPATPMQPAAPVQPQPATPGVPAAAQQPGAPLFVCPVHGQGWRQNQVHPHYRCPIGNRPLVQRVQ